MKAKGRVLTQPTTTSFNHSQNMSQSSLKLKQDTHSKNRKDSKKQIMKKARSIQQESNSEMSENLGDEERENQDGPNKPNEELSLNKVISVAASTFIYESGNGTFSPLLKNSDNHQKETNCEEPEDEITEIRPLQTEAIDKRLTGVARQYTFDSKPILKRLRSQTSIKDPIKEDFQALAKKTKAELTMQFESTQGQLNKLSHASPNQHQLTLSHQQHESIENLYTLKKVQSKVRDKQIHWIEFSSTAATFNKQQQEDTMSNQQQQEQQFLSSGNLALKLSQVHLRRKNNYGSPNDKMQIYKFYNKTKQNEYQQEEFQEDSLCITEENRYENVINPIKLADLGWSDNYKLDKLIYQQIQQVDKGIFDPECYFGGVNINDYDEAFYLLEQTRNNMESQLMRRKSSGGGIFGTSALFDEIKYQTGDFNKATLMLNLDEQSSSSDDDDEAEKFVQQTIKNTFLKNSQGNFKSKTEKNLLLKVDLDDQDNFEEEEQYNRRTPKVLENSDNQENRPLAIAKQVLEELREESREESQRGDSNTLFYVPQPLQKVGDLHQQILDQKFYHIVGQIDHEIIKETKSNRTGGSFAVRQYDSDIFVMSNTTFDEDMNSKSSRRVSLGKQPYKNELLNFVNNSQEMKVLQQRDSKQLNEITSKLFGNQQTQRRQQKYQQNKDIIQQNKEEKCHKPSQISNVNNQTMISMNQHSITQGKTSNITKFSNYMSVSNNLTPTPLGYQKVYQKNKDSKYQQSKIKINSQYNSINSFNGLPFTQAQNTISMNSNQQSMLSSQSIPFNNNHKITKSNSNELMNQQKIAINTSSQFIVPQIISHHSPQCSIISRQNLSPLPGYKIKERNTIFDQRNPSNQEGDLNSRFIMIKPNQFCSNEFKSDIHHQQQKINIKSQKQSKQQLNNTTLGSKEKQSYTQKRLKESMSDREFKQQCIIDTSVCSNSMATYKLLSSIKQSIINKKSHQKKLSQQKSDSTLQGLTRQRSKSEIETIPQNSTKNQNIQKQGKVKHITLPLQSKESISPCKSMKNIGPPYQCKTMTQINKFSEQRQGCRSVMNKQYQRIDKNESKQYISLDSHLRTNDNVNLSINSSKYRNQSPLFQFSGKDTLISLPIETANSPVFCETQKSRQIQGVLNSMNFGIQPHHSLDLQPKFSIAESNNGQSQQNNLEVMNVLKQRVQKSPCKKSIIALNSSIGSNSNNVSIIAQVSGNINTTINHRKFSQLK